LTETAGVAAQFADLTQQREAARIGMWVFLMSEVMFFGALFVVYFYNHFLYSGAFQAAGARTDLPLAAANTAFLLLSSLTMALAVQAAKEGRGRDLRTRLGLTLILGTGFLVMKGLEYAEHIQDHLLPGAGFVFTPAAQARPAELFFYLYFVMTGLHALHMLVGLAWIGGLALWSGRSEGSPASFTRIEVAGLYWHFIDIVWIFLFPMFYLVRRH
jgi:cytochrome c oxidase subunit 3